MEEFYYMVIYILMLMEFMIYIVITILEEDLEHIEEQELGLKLLEQIPMVLFMLLNNSEHQ